MRSLVPCKKRLLKNCLVYGYCEWSSLGYCRGGAGREAFLVCLFVVLGSSRAVVYKLYPLRLELKCLAIDVEAETEAFLALELVLALSWRGIFCSGGCIMPEISSVKMPGVLRGFGCSLKRASGRMMPIRWYNGSSRVLPRTYFGRRQ